MDLIGHHTAAIRVDHDGSYPRCCVPSLDILFGHMWIQMGAGCVARNVMTEQVVFYRKQGRKYIPVYHYDQKLMDSFPKGTHLVDCYPGGKLTRFNVDPAYAPMIAAGRVARDAISDHLRKASDMRPSKIPITEGQRRAWHKLSKEFGEESHALTWPSALDAADAAVDAMQAEAEKLLTNPAVRKAYDHFLLLCELTKNTKDQ